jgi:hypothetical protein
MTDLAWKAPPSMRKRGRRPSQLLNDVANKLKARPGHWALVVEGAKSPNATAVWISRGCESTSSRREDGTFDIYAMYPEGK